MNTIIIDYLTSEKQLTQVAAQLVEAKLSKYSDIEDEFIKCITNRTFDLADAICVNGYTSSAIHSMAPFLDASGVYGFLVTLRDDPDKAQQIIEQGFPQK